MGIWGASDPVQSELLESFSCTCRYTISISFAASRRLDTKGGREICDLAAAPEMLDTAGCSCNARMNVRTSRSEYALMFFEVPGMVVVVTRTLPTR